MPTCRELWEMPTYRELWFLSSTKLSKRVEEMLKMTLLLEDQSRQQMIKMWKPNGKRTAYTCERRRVTKRGSDPPLCGAPRGNEIRTKFANLTPGAKHGRFYNRISPAKWLIHFFRFTRRIKVYWALFFLFPSSYTRSFSSFKSLFGARAISLKNELRACWPICQSPCAAIGARLLIRVPLYVNCAVRYSTPEIGRDLEN